MAWYALYKWFRPFRTIPYVNMISEYRRYLFEEWYNGLSDEDREIYDRIEREEEEKRKKSLARSFAMIGNVFNHIYNQSYPHAYMADNYGVMNAIRGMTKLVKDL